MGKTTTWERTPVQNLLRNGESGRYFGRWTVAGKQIWRTLDTDVFSVAKLRLGVEAAKIEARRGRSAAVASGAGTMGDLMALYAERTQASTDLKPSSISARLVALKKLQKTWPGLAALKPTQVSRAAVNDWVAQFKAEGTNYTPPGAKTAIKGNSATSVNHAIDTLRRLLDLAIERGSLHANPVAIKSAEGRLKKKVAPKKPVMPSSSDLQRLFAAMENNGARGGWGAEAADFCRFLAYSGCRVGEAPLVTWADVDFDKKRVRVAGYKSETSDRIVPLFAELEALLKKVLERRKSAARFAVAGKPYIDPRESLFRLKEAQKTIDAACARLGIERITHHGFRHVFCTRCIESGVDIPTVSRWVGHADGGALLMKTYGHLRQEHSMAQAMKVIFGG